MEEQTIKCPICGDPYVIYPFYAYDQSACSKCREKARSGKHDSKPLIDIVRNSANT